jgi:hypothetical protein
MSRTGGPLEHRMQLGTASHLAAKHASHPRCLRLAVQLMEGAGVPPHAHQTAFDQVDSSGDGTVDYHEFSLFFSKAMNDPGMHHRIRCYVLGGQ